MSLRILRVRKCTCYYLMCIGCAILGWARELMWFAQSCFGTRGDQLRLSAGHQGVCALERDATDGTVGRRELLVRAEGLRCMNGLQCDAIMKQPRSLSSFKNRQT